MSPHKIGPKEQQRIDLRLKRHAERGPGSRRQTKARRLMTPKQILDLCNLEAEIMTESAPCVGFSKPFNAPVQASAPPKETTMNTKRQRKSKAKVKRAKVKKARVAAKAVGPIDKPLTSKQRGKSANASTSRAEAADARSWAERRKPVPALDVANFMARPVGHKDAPLGGASMEELVKQFGIEAHPMRAKIHYIKHQIAGWSVENRDGRYFATAPAA